MKSIVLLESGHDETLVFQVRSSQKKGKTHNVYVDVDHGFVCTCEDYYFRHRFCKHMQYVCEYWEKFHEAMEKQETY